MNSRSEDIFWATATSANGFILDGASYTDQAVANGAKVAEGDKVLVARTCHGLSPGRRRQMVILQSSNGRNQKGMSRNFFQSSEIPIGVGTWSQHYGYWFQPGKNLAAQPPITLTGASSLLIDMEDPAATGFSGRSIKRVVRGLVGFPESGRQVVAAVGGSYEPGNPIYENNPWTHEVSVVSSSPNPPDSQLPSRQYGLPYAAVPGSISVGATNYHFNLWNTQDVVQDTTTTFRLPKLPPSNTVTVALDWTFRDTYHSSFHDAFFADGISNEFNMRGGYQNYLTSGGNKLGPSTQILSLVLVRVDGNDETSTSTFDENGKVYLATAPTAGAYVEIWAEIYELSHGFAQFGQPFTTFPLSGGDGPFSLLWAGVDGDDFSHEFFINQQSESGEFNSVLQAGQYVEVDFIARIPVGESSNLSGLHIVEGTIPATPLRKLTIPISPTIPADPVDREGETVINYTGAWYHGGQLFLDLARKEYTLASLAGLAWRNRLPLTDPLPPEGAHYRLTPWPDDGISADKSYRYLEEVEGQYVETGPFVARRPSPELCFSAASQFGLQGSWMPVDGYRADTNFFLRTWLRNLATGQWAPLATLSVKDLAQAPDQPENLVVHAAGVTDVLCQLGGRQFGVSDNYNGWPCSRNQLYWVVAAAWHCFDQAAHEASANKLVFGPSSSGLTFNSIRTSTGQRVGQFTIQAPTEVLDIWQDIRDAIDDAIVDNDAYHDIIIDKYHNNNPAYWPPQSGSDPAPPHAGSIIFVSDPEWNEFPTGTNYWWHFYQFNGVGSERATTLRAAPPPMLNEWDSVFGGKGQQYGPTRNNPIPLQMDETNHIYSLVRKTFWARDQDEAYGNTTKTEYGTYTESREAILGAPNGLSRCDLFVGRLISGPDTRDPAGSVFANGVAQPFVLRPTVTGFNEPIRGCVAYRPQTFVGLNEFNQPIFDYPAVTFLVKYRYVAVDTQYCSGPTEYEGGRAFEFPTFSGFQNSPQPYLGFKIWDAVMEWTRNYRTMPKWYLYKLALDESNGQITEVWQQDITRTSRSNLDVLNPAIPALTDLPDTDQAPIWHKACGRVWFVIRPGKQTPSAPWSQQFMRELRIEIYANGNAAPGNPLHTIALPTTLHDVRQSTADLASFCGAYVGIDADGREHVTINLIRDSSYNPRDLVVQVRMAANLGASPSVTSQAGVLQADPAAPVPNRSEYRGTLVSRLLQAGGHYAWEDTSFAQDSYQIRFKSI